VLSLRWPQRFPLLLWLVLPRHLALRIIVIILSDDQRLGLDDAMPVVSQQIKQQGVSFTNYMVPTSLCCPSRASSGCR
jgi:hypothetical protein